MGQFDWSIFDIGFGILFVPNNSDTKLTVKSCHEHCYKKMGEFLENPAMKQRCKINQTSCNTKEQDNQVLINGFMRKKLLCNRQGVAKIWHDEQASGFTHASTHHHGQLDEKNVLLASKAHQEEKQMQKCCCCHHGNLMSKRAFSCDKDASQSFPLCEMTFASTSSTFLQ